MFKNYLLIAIRNLNHQRFYAALNILGLAIGITGFILAALWVKDELSYDRHFRNADRIYRMECSLITDGVPEPMAAADPRITDRVRRQYPEVGTIARLYKVPSLLSYNNEKKYLQDTYYADSTFFNIFSYSFAEGNPETALLKEGSIVITQAVALQLFGTGKVLGRSIYVNNTRTKDKPRTFRITGVLKDDDRPSHLHPQAIVAKFRRIETVEVTYILFNEDYDIASFRKTIWEPMYASFFRQDYYKDGQDITFDRFQPLTRIHLGGNKWEDVGTNGDIALLYVFSAIAIIILIIACINYINLATARSFMRAREVGVRKVLGATTRQLMFQFLTESVVLCLIALMLALSFSEMALPYFNALAGKTLSLPTGNIVFITSIALFVIILGIASGLYPAFSIVSYQPARSLQDINSPRKLTLRKVLVVVQFSITIIMLIATFIIARQLSYVKRYDLGFDNDRILLVYLNDQKVNAQKEAFKDSILRHPSVIRVSAAYNIPGSETNHTYINFETDKGFSPKLVNSMFVDYDYINVMGLTLLQGRNFDSAMLPTLDTSAYLIANESAAKMLGYKNIIGKKLETGYFYGQRKGRIIGVVKDFHASSLRDTIRPLFLILGTVGRPEGKTNFLSIKIKSEDLFNTIRYVHNVYEAFGQGSPFRYTFLDEEFNRQYQNEEKQKTLFNWLAGLSIFISCLGLIGLTSFFMRQRTKEICIRKISGATIGDMLWLVSGDFIRLVLVSLLIASPIAYIIMQQWLNNFAYHIAISWWVFAIAFIIMLSLVVITVFVQLLFAFYKNPASVLRYE